MRAGKITSLILVLIVTAVGTALSVSATAIPWLAALSPVLRTILSFTVIGLASTALLLPLGIAIDRNLTRLRSYIEATGSRDGQTATFAGPRWVRPITGAVIEAVEQFRQREQSLSNELREVELRRRVSEAERGQTDAVFHSLRDGVLVTDSFGDIVVANEAAGRILQFDPAEAIHKNLENFVRDQRLCQLIKDTSEAANFADRRHVEHEIAVPAEDGKGPDKSKVFDVRHVLRLPDGAEFWRRAIRRLRVIARPCPRSVETTGIRCMSTCGDEASIPINPKIMYRLSSSGR